MTDKLSKAQAGSLGGRATVARHGRQHMQAIGQRGAAALYARYRLIPVGVTGWALICKESGKIKAAWNCAALRSQP